MKKIIEKIKSFCVDSKEGEGRAYTGLVMFGVGFINGAKTNDWVFFWIVFSILAIIWVSLAIYNVKKEIK